MKNLNETKKMLVANNVGDAKIIGMALDLALSSATRALPPAWKATTDLIGVQFNEQQRTNSDACLTVLTDAIAGLSAAAPGATLELPYVVGADWKPVLGDDGKPVANAKYAAEAWAVPWMEILLKLLPIILALLFVNAK